MDITDKKYYNNYLQSLPGNIALLAEKFLSVKDNADLQYTTQTSAVYSSNIEGNSIDLNSFMNYKAAYKKSSVKELKEIEDLIKAYEFAREQNLSEKNFLKVHKILSKSFVIKGLQGKYRKDKVGVFGDAGLVYLAIEAEYIQPTMKDFFMQITKLLEMDLSVEEVFYHASLIHLRFAHIHPFSDGNGIAARLLEKWFIAEKAGKEFWKIASEKYYKEHLKDYYANINLGVNFYELNYDKCLPFLLMLVKSLE